jgi:hypothetical protein
MPNAPRRIGDRTWGRQHGDAAQQPGAPLGAYRHRRPQLGGDPLDRLTVGGVRPDFMM